MGSVAVGPLALGHTQWQPKHSLNMETNPCYTAFRTWAVGCGLCVDRTPRARAVGRRNPNTNPTHDLNPLRRLQILQSLCPQGLPSHRAAALFGKLGFIAAPHEP